MIKRLLGCLLLFVVACAGDSLFIPIGNNLSGPIAIVLDTGRSRAYVVNSNLNVAYLNASLVVLDISDPTAPAFLDNANNPIAINDLSGQAFLDEASQQLFMTNRYSPNKDDIIDDLFVIDVSEGTNLGTQQAFESGENPFGISCCDASGRFYVVSDGALEVFTLSDPSQSVSRSLLVQLSNGHTFEGLSTTHVVLLGNQAFLSNQAGIIYVINLDNVGDTSKNPIDYLITEMEDLRGIATDGTNIYVVEVDFDDQDESRLRVINPATLPAIADNNNTVTEVAIGDSRDVGGVSTPIQSGTTSLGDEANEILIIGTNAYVTNEDDDNVMVVDISDPTNVSASSTISVGDEPFAMATATIGTQDLLYVTNLKSNNISIIDLATNAVVGTYP